MKLIMTKGLPASGKSTWAKQYLDDNPGTKRVNKDDLRAMLDNGKWSKRNEQTVLSIRDEIIGACLFNGDSIIVDDTNLAPKHENDLRAIANAYKAEFIIQDFTHVPLEECLKRDKGRQNPVGEAVILRMYNDFLKKPVEPAPISNSLPWCVICDLDGTAFKMNGRGPFEWDKVDTDLPRTHVIDAVLGLAAADNSRVIFVSGRDSVCRDKTILSINRHIGLMPGSSCDLLMRPAGDNRKDSIIKRELYENHILGKYNVRAVFDDRAQVTRTWKELGLGDRTFRVGLIDEDDF